jgi:hypothetical protein
VTAGPVRTAAALALVGVAAAFAYAPSFAVPFQFDDYARIIDNAPLQEGRYQAALGWLGTSRVLPSLTIVANYLAGGDQVAGYHAVNFALHLLAGLAVFVLVGLVCDAPRLRGTAAARHRLAAATVAALLMACHPLQTQAVTYIIQRAAVMAALCYVAAVACYLRARLAQLGARPGRPAIWFAATLALGAAALLSKENAASLPLAILLSELVVIGGRPTRRALAIGAAAFAALVMLPLIGKVATWRPAMPDGPPLGWVEYVTSAILAQGAGPATATPFTYFLTQATVVPRYLALILMPWGQSVDHDVAIASGLSFPVVAGLTLLAALVVAGVALARRAPLAGYGLLWIFVALSVESSVLPISDAMMEHRVYLAMPGVGMLAASAFTGTYARRPRAAVAAALLVGSLLVGLTFARNLVWQSPVALWLDAAEKAPRKARVLVNYGVALHGAGHLEAASRQYCQALRLDPNLDLAGENLELALDRMGLLDDLVGRAVARKGETVVVEVDLIGGYCDE